MHRRMSLGLGLLLMMVFLAGSASALPESPAATEARTVESFDLLDWVWEWITSLVSDGTSTSGGGHLTESEGGVFIDPLGGSNS